MSPFAKQALSAKHAYVAALLAGAAALANAQTPAAPGSMPGDTTVGAAHSGMMMRHEGGHRDPARMQAMIAKRLGELKAKLKLAPEQEAAWTTFTTAMTPPAMAGKMERPNPADMAKLSTPERIDKMRAMHDQRHATMSTRMNQRGEAAKAFYATLTAEQKTVFDAETLKMASRRHGAMGGHTH
jgi:hypothetical protein